MNRNIFRSSLLLLVLTVSGFVSTKAHAQAPVNDNFANARVLPGISGTIPGTNVDATKQAGEPNHAGDTGGASVWYRWTAPHSSNVTISAFGNGFSPLLAVYTGNAVNALAEIASNFDPVSPGIPSSVTFETVAGTVYQIAIDGFNFSNGAQTGPFTLNYLLGPANDNFANARILPGTSGAVPGTNIGASEEAGEPNHVGNPGGASVWYRWTATYSSNVTINTLGNGFPTLLAVYTGNAVNALTEIASNFNPSSTGAPSSVSFGAVAGTVYQIAVDGSNPDTGAQTGTFALDYFQFAPEITVEESGGGNIPDNGPISFGSVGVGNNASLSFTVRNTGSDDLTGLGIVIDGPHASEFTVTTNPIAPVTEGTSTTFTVAFSPSARGIRTAVIHIANNDADENPFDIRINGTGLAPEIAVQQPPGANVPNNGSRNFGNVPVGSSAPLNFIIRNNGNSNLTVPLINIGGPDAAEYILTGNPSPTVVPGGSTNFTVQFVPRTVGTKNARIRIGSNDADENPFDILITGTGVAPEIAVQQSPGADIPNNGSSNFGRVGVGSDATLTFTIRNNGSSDLALPFIRIDGPSAAEFILTGNPSTTVAPGGNTSFTVRFAPATPGPKAAAIFIGSNDFDESPFNIFLSGSGVAPEIAVQQPPGANLPNNGSRNFGKVLLGSNKPMTFIIRNNGSSELALPIIRIEGPAAPEFTLTRLPSDTVNPGGSTRFTVRFSPNKAGIRNAAIFIGSNDTDESPFNIILKGNGVEPEIAVQQAPGTNIPDNGSSNFGKVSVGSSAPLNFIIRNKGSSELALPFIRIEGSAAPEFTLTRLPSNTVNPGGSTRFTVQFTPATVGTKTAAIIIGNNDRDESPFNIALNGVGDGPEITVSESVEGNVANGDQRDFGTVTVGQTGATRTFTITNDGATDLSGLSLTTSGNKASYIVTPISQTTLPPGASTTFTTTFTPDRTGSRKLVIRIASDDLDEAPFEVTLTGTGSNPEIAIELEGGENIPDQGMLDFGPAIVCKDRPVRRLTIRNLGTENLTSLAVSTSSSTGFFFSSALRVTSLAPGASTTFKVTFCPGYYGNWKGALSIRSNDKDESPFDIILSGSGVARLEKSPAAGLLADSLKSSAPSARQERSLSKVRVMVNPDDGVKYLTLEIIKAPGTENHPRAVEVSPNLMDWYSGRKHTTVIRDDAKVLKVRDNTPFRPGSKRFIRLRDS